MRYNALFSAQLTLLALLLPVSSAADPPVIAGEYGLSYAGLRNSTSGQDYFLGIPFAQPPIGPLRFKPPVPWSRGSTKVVNATQYGYSCVQSAQFTNSSVSEDCLTLNIWKPTKVEKKLPVMVWIHGGAFYIGEAKKYPGNYLVERACNIGKPIIYVTMNYRLGIFGFPPGQAAEDAGASNIGLKYQRLALEWVQKNIAHFGGDPTKTLYKGGHIGGAFRGMILESGSPFILNVLKPNDPVKEEAFALLANTTGCNAKASDAFECVRKAPGDVLKQVNNDLLK
ncbi:hypothetical protein FRC12_022897, partial [Ceratobasidium sp. 428]